MSIGYAIVKIGQNWLWINLPKIGHKIGQSRRSLEENHLY